MPRWSLYVRCWGQSGKDMLPLSFSAFDPGCVKTCTSQECAKLFSLSSSLSSGRKHFWFSHLRNREGVSTRRLNVGVFTRPRPKAQVGPGKWCARSCPIPVIHAVPDIRQSSNRRTGRLAVEGPIRDDVFDITARHAAIHELPAVQAVQLGAFPLSFAPFFALFL